MREVHGRFMSVRGKKRQRRFEAKATWRNDVFLLKLK
jgi:hypothetical protein